MPRKNEKNEGAQADRIEAIKYMGAADERIIEKGENSGKTLPSLGTKLVWNKDNDWIVQVSDYPDVYDAWWEFLASQDGDFAVVSVDEGSPLNKHQATFLGMRGNPMFNKELDRLSTDANTPGSSASDDPVDAGTGEAPDGGGTVTGGTPTGTSTATSGATSPGGTSTSTSSPI